LIFGSHTEYKNTLTFENHTEYKKRSGPNKRIFSLRHKNMCHKKPLAEEKEGDKHLQIFKV
jgi:hypothetical protein